MENTNAMGNGFDSSSDPNEIPETQRQNETPEREQADRESQGYSQQQEVQQNNDGNDASYSEHNDVERPEQHEFPSEGRAQTDFTPHHNRSTGRMVGHEPGTEGI